MKDVSNGEYILSRPWSTHTGLKVASQSNTGCSNESSCFTDSTYIYLYIYLDMEYSMTSVAQTV
jgi:hypothetical protein